jgi:hypothetical protein
MAKKRGGTPQKPQPDDELLAVFAPEPEPVGVRETYGTALPDDTSGPKREGDEGAGLTALFGGSKSPPIDVKTVESPPDFGPIVSSVDEYIKDQVLTEMYGTTTPSEHDKIQLAIKRML